MDDALNLIVLVINALHGLLSVYGKDYTMLNVDGVFGLRIIEGQLKRLHSSHFEHIPIEIIDELRSISQNASNLANMALPHVYQDDPVYFKKFKYLIHEPWNLFKPHRFLKPGLEWPVNAHDGHDCAGAAESDECMSELTEPSVSVAEGWSRDQDVFGCKRITQPCLQTMLKTKGCKGYSLAHQLLYVMVAELVGCSVVTDEYARSLGYEHGVYDFVGEFCANLYSELKIMTSEPRSASKKLKARKFQLDIESRKQDMFLEFQFVCGQLGFVEFARREWLEVALSWQTETGCYSHRNQLSESIPARRLLAEKELADHCASHKSTVAAGALTFYLRLLMDLEPVRLDSQPSVYDAIPAEGRWWSRPARWTYSRTDKEPWRPLPVPYPARFRDRIFFWFLSVALCFLYITYRICRRQNVRYRFRGLK